MMGSQGSIWEPLASDKADKDKEDGQGGGLTGILF